MLENREVGFALYSKMEQIYRSIVTAFPTYFYVIALLYVIQTVT